MAYLLSPDDPSLQAALRRIAAEELVAALARFATGELSPGAVHDIRKRIKKLRGLLRLVQRDFPDFATENAALRDAGRLLSLRRDAEVRFATFDGLFPDAPPPLAALRSQLRDGHDAADAALAEGEASEVLRAVQGRVGTWALTGEDGAILLHGLRATRRRALRAMKLAARSRGFDAIHDWRKRAKDFWYQTRLLTPIWPEVMVPLAQEADDLTEALGHHHDIAVLATHLPPGLLPPDAAALFSHRAGAAQQAIEARVFAQGRRLFAGDPQAMARLWQHWWVLWRDQAASAPDSARSISATVSSTP